MTELWSYTEVNNMKKKIKKIRKFWRGFNIVKLLRGYKTIKLTKEEAEDIFFRTHCLETDAMARVVSDRTGVPYGITHMILNNAEFDVMVGIGLIKD